MIRKFLVKKDERALLFRKGDFEEILEAGEYRYFDPLKRYSVERFPLSKALFEHRLADYLIKSEAAVVASEFTLVELNATEAGLRYENGVLVEVLAPSVRRLYWKGYLDVRVDKIDIASNLRVEVKLLSQLVESAAGAFRAKVPGATEVYAVQVPQYQVALLYVNGKFVELLEAGLHAFWRFGRDVSLASAWRWMVCSRTW